MFAVFSRISGDKKSLNLDYLPYMRTSLTQPLVEREAEGVRDVIQMMEEYDIVKDDFDNIMDITRWPNSTDPLSKLSTQVWKVMGVVDNCKDCQAMHKKCVINNSYYCAFQKPVQMKFLRYYFYFSPN